ncbi:MAG: glutathione S-transferase family protein [Deltaproteobacteria bacterium]|nr:glutathione S-transferase family protein [Deltaproteobacteria bacterium]
MGTRPKLWIGNRNYSSWSLRPWLVLRWGGIDFEEEVIPLGEDGYGAGKIAAVRAVSPTGRVPVLHLGGDVVVWDSLAISEWAAERAPGLWPEDEAARAVARSVTAEMHSGYGALRRDLSMNIRRRVAEPAWPEDTREDIARVTGLWEELRGRYGAGGPWLFGARSVADAFFAPVVTRFRTYGVPMEGVVAAYAEVVLGDPDFRAWEGEAEREVWVIGGTDGLWG